jgi:FkbM family methyltransferase
MYIDWSQFRSLVYDSWEPEVVRKVISAIQPGMTVVDVGAHVGYYTLLFAKNVGSSGRVLSFEPLPANFAVLQKNVEINGLKYVELFTSALFSSSRELAINLPTNSNSGEASVTESSDPKRMQIRATTLDAITSELNVRPDFIKIDVEGCEWDVIAGAQETIKRSRPAMLIELHHFDGDVARHPVPNLLETMGYHVEWIERSFLTSHIFASVQPEPSRAAR